MSIDANLLEHWEPIYPIRFTDIAAEPIEIKIEDKYTRLEKRVRALEIALSQFTYVPEDLDAGELL